MQEQRSFSVLGRSAVGRAEQQISYEAGDLIEVEGETQPNVKLLTSGWAAACRILTDGRRQLTHLYVTGDVIGAAPLRLRTAPFSTLALTRVRVAHRCRLADMLDASGRDEALVEKVKAAAQAHTMYALTQITRLGVMTALERTADLLLELYERLETANLAQANVMDFPLLQQHLADVLGLSVVHINRVLQELRRAGALVGPRAGRLMLDLEKLSSFAGRIAQREQHPHGQTTAGQSA